MKPNAASQTTPSCGYSAGEVAQFFIHLANRDSVETEEGSQTEGITNLKLQKMLYFAQAYYLGIFGKALFDDDLQAWKFGPVVESVYHQYKASGNLPIEQNPDPAELSLREEDLKILEDDIWPMFGKYSAVHLMDMSHAHTPWNLAIRRDDGIVRISDMKDYYTNQLTT